MGNSLMTITSSSVQKRRPCNMNAFLGWIEERIPMMRVANMHALQYPAPKNMNFWYVFGFLATIVLVNQIVTGIWLTMNFVPSSEGAFASVEYIMREIDYGWIIRYMHSTGASAFFIVVYLHMFRGMIYGSYQKPRELLWVTFYLGDKCLTGVRR